MKHICILFASVLIVSHAFAWNGTGSQGDPYQISTPADLVELSESTLSHEGEYFIMTTDIDMAGISDFRAIGTANAAFKGNFNGQDFQIKNLRVSKGITQFGGSQSNVALFGDVDKGIIENVHITGDSYFEGAKYVAAIVGDIQGVVRNCSSSGTVVGTGDYSQYIAGIVGFGDTVQGCFNTGNVTTEGTNASHTAGVVGSTTGGGFISDCYNSGTITGNDYVAGVCGFVATDGSLLNCNNRGTIHATGNYVGGVAGSVSGGLLSTAGMSGCYNIGKVTGNNYVGGAVGQTAITTFSCNIGEVVGNDYVGGVAGAGTVNNSYNKGSVTGINAVGGIIGNLNNVNNCYNTGDITGDNRVGGIAGEITDVTNNKIQNSYNVGNVSIQGSLTSIGGVAGYVNSGGLANSNEIKNTYWNKDIYSGVGVGGRTNPAEGATGDFLYYGRTSAELRNDFSQVLGTANWEEDLNNVNNGYPILGGEITLFYTLTTFAGQNGSIIPGDTVVAAGESVEYRFYPASGYEVDSVFVDGVFATTNTTYLFENIDNNHTIEVQFIEAETTFYTLTAVAGANGSIVPGDTVVAAGESVEYRFYPASGYEVDSVFVDGTFATTNTTYLFENIDNNHTIEVQFKSAPCTTPTGLHVTNVTSTSAVLGWTSTNPQSYTIRYKREGETNYTEQTGIANNSYTLSSLSSGTRYEWSVKSVCVGDESEWAGNGDFTTITVGIENNAVLSTIKVYNIQNVIYLINDNSIYIKQIEIFDIYGKKIYNKESVCPSEIILSNVATGIYFVRLLTDEGIGTYKLYITE